MEVDRGALWEAASIIIIRARPMEALALLPKDDGQGSVITHQPNFNNSKCRPWQWSLGSKGTSNVMRDTFNV